MERADKTYKNEDRTIEFFLKLFFFFFHLSIMTEIVASPSIGIVIRLLFFIYITKPYYKTIKSRFYTYWTFSFLLLGYLIYKTYEHYQLYNLPHIALLYFVTLCILLVKMHLLSSPIYYPRVNWWEYDFRYRDDLKISVKHTEEEHESRLTDLRRHAGCVALFEELKIGEEIIIKVNLEEDSVNLRAKIRSKRRELIGRPFIYGVEFKFDSRTNKKRYGQLVKIWKKEKNNKKKLKFAHA